MKNSFEWILFDCFNTLIDDFDDTGDESGGLAPMIHLPVEAGFFTAETEYRNYYDEWRRSRWTGDDWREVYLADRLREVLTPKDPARQDEVETLVNRMLSQFDAKYPDLLRPTPGVYEMLQT